jgi:sulfide:quinone oxidoreductase
MKKLLILGAGTAGTMMANKMKKDLPGKEWKITVVEQNRIHYYQPGFLFLPFGYYKTSDISKPQAKFIPAGVEMVTGRIDRIDPDNNTVVMEDGQMLSYDILVVATGTRISPDDTPGLRGELWQKHVFDFYTIEGAEALTGFLKDWKGGRLVVNIADNPIKCPVAPLEFAFLADAWLKEKGIRDKVDIVYVTPLSGAFTKPRSSRILGGMLAERNIELVTDFFLGEVDNDKKVIRDFGGREVAFDCLITIPLHSGDPCIQKSGLGDEFGFVKTDRNTLQSLSYKNIFVIGDATNIPASKAGSVAHFQSEVLSENILCFIEGKPFSARFDGHSNCYIETGHGKAILIDFNYDTEPLPGVYPVPVLGPFSLLKESRMNHWGKLLFKWIYWNILLRGRKMPVTAHMSMAGKRTNTEK